MEQTSTPDETAPAESALVVVRPFGRHAAGDLIEQSGIVRETLRGENAGNVVAMRLPNGRAANRKGV